MYHLEEGSTKKTKAIFWNSSTILEVLEVLIKKPSGFFFWSEFLKNVYLEDADE